MGLIQLARGKRVGDILDDFIYAFANFAILTIIASLLMLYDLSCNFDLCLNAVTDFCIDFSKVLFAIDALLSASISIVFP